MCQPTINDEESPELLQNISTENSFEKSITEAVDSLDSIENVRSNTISSRPIEKNKSVEKQSSIEKKVWKLKWRIRFKLFIHFICYYRMTWLLKLQTNHENISSNSLNQDKIEKINDQDFPESKELYPNSQKTVMEDEKSNAENITKIECSPFTDKSTELIKMKPVKKKSVKIKKVKNYNLHL